MCDGIGYWDADYDETAKVIHYIRCRDCNGTGKVSWTAAFILYAGSGHAEPSYREWESAVKARERSCPF